MSPRKKEFECICGPEDWVGRITSHDHIDATTPGPYHSEWVCSLRVHRADAEASVRKLGLEPIYIGSK